MKTWTEAELRPLIEAAAVKHGVNPTMLFGQLKHESANFAPSVLAGKRKSSAGAVGIAQFMPDTATEYGVDPLDIPQAVDGAARYMAKLTKTFGDEQRALQAYNWGQGNLRKHLRDPAKHPMPKETREYTGRVAKAAGGGDDAAMRTALKSIGQPPAQAVSRPLPGVAAPAGGPTDTMPLATPFAAAPSTPRTADWRASLPSNQTFAAGAGGGLAMPSAEDEFTLALEDAVANRQDAMLAGAFADAGVRPTRDTSNIPGAVDRFLDKLLLA